MLTQSAIDLINDLSSRLRLEAQRARVISCAVDR